MVDGKMTGMYWDLMTFGDLLILIGLFGLGVVVGLILG